MMHTTLQIHASLSLSFNVKLADILHFYFLQSYSINTSLDIVITKKCTLFVLAAFNKAVNFKQLVKTKQV